MDNTLVSARVPKAKKEAAAKALESQGSTMSELINDAIDQVLEYGTIPPIGPQAHRPSPEAFNLFVKQSTLDIDWPEDTPEDYRDLEREWRRDDYESLA